MVARCAARSPPARAFATLAVVSVPAELPGIGSTAQKLRVSPGFDPLRAGVGPEEYFVMSRIDGATSLRDVIVTTGLPLNQAIAIVTKLRTLGALLLPGEVPRQTTPTISFAPPGGSAAASSPAITPPPNASNATGPSSYPASLPRTGRPSSSPSIPLPSSSPAAARTGRPSSSPSIPLPTQPSAAPLPPSAARAATRSEPPQRRASTAPPIASPASASSPGRAATEPPIAPAAPAPVALPLDTTLPDPDDLELAILAADLEVPEAERRVILAMARRIGSDPWTILGIAKGAEPSALKKVYFRLSKDVHPDRYYGKRLGPLAPVLSNVFEAVSRAYTTLTEAKKQRARPSNASSPQAPAEHAIELFDRGCAAEVSGDLPTALQLFAASLRVDPQLRVFRRGASCALAAAQPKLALEYAKKAQALAPDDPSNARLLARAFRANAELSAAEEVLVFALALPIDNDSLMAELRADLALVRKQLTQA